MKKIVLASAAMGGAALVAFGASGTFAAFSDQDSSDVSGAQAGTLYLQRDGNVVSDEAVIENLAPGDTVDYQFYVENAGNLPGTVTATFRILSDLENGCVPAEQRNGANDTSCDDTQPGAGELVDQLTGSAIYGPATREECEDRDVPSSFSPPTFAQFDGAVARDQAVPAGEGFCAVVTVTLPDRADNNLVQSDSVSFGIDYRLDQA
ncbi:TasA family protein [Klenkia taihuensis]|uniref:SipW-cognate class signal peptide n=1 Tax=Klenkia taihuensis TaxID=1225127 RepID=A0A1I1QBW0_9ACTN|nr:TasA family protein [Klenkia taihuensis]GHE07961.1 hypothetical protein GCM10011381_06680 [Klenkia taihuensis]SFD19507.1 SipW-cognate class signal peptide [Klenkia taihuensis]